MSKACPVSRDFEMGKNVYYVAVYGADVFFRNGFALWLCCERLFPYY